MTKTGTGSEFPGNQSHPSDARPRRSWGVRVFRAIKEPIEYWLFLSLHFIVQHVPFRATTAFGGFLGAAVFRCTRVRKRVTMDNLRHAFPEKGEEELRRIACGAYRNYGIAIILLTIVMRLILMPLTIKQTKSMYEMQKIQPKIKALQDKYKNDKEKQQEELMKFYQENKVNPFGGCLPLLIQMPIFIALFRVLGKDGPLFKLIQSMPHAAQVEASKFWVILPSLTPPVLSYWESVPHWHFGLIVLAMVCMAYACGAGADMVAAFDLLTRHPAQNLGNQAHDQTGDEQGDRQDQQAADQNAPL